MKKRKKFKRKNKFKIENFILKKGLIFLIFLVILYIYQFYFLAQKIAILKEKSKRLEVLTKEKDKLEITLSQATSLENLRKLLANLNFEKIEKIEYLKVPSIKVVKKQ